MDAKKMSDAAEIAIDNQPALQQATLRLKYRNFLRQVVGMIAPYWKSEEKSFAWIVLTCVIALNMAGIYCAVLLNKWNASFYNALQALDKDNFKRLLFQFLGIIMVYITILVSEYFMQAYLAFRWRVWLTKQVMADWLHDATFCRLFSYKAKTENPDQRISQDIAILTSSTLSLSLSIITQCVKSITFAYILWTLSSSLPLPLPGGHKLDVPGYLLWLTVLYVAFSTYVIYRTGRPLVKLDYVQEKVEADFRFSLMRIRERRDEVSMLNGAKAENRFLIHNLKEVVKNYKQIIKRNVYINSFQNVFINLTTILPILAAAPMFFAGAITLGVLMQIANAFNQVEGALMIFASNFQAFASWKATFNRIFDFRGEMEALKHTLANDHSELSIKSSPQYKHLHVQNLSLHLPESQNLAHFNFKIEAGEHVLIMGRSGLGKSTLLKCIAGYWPYASGNIERPQELTIVPQKPYFPIGTLRDSLLYPNLDLDVSDQQMYAALEKCQLEVLKGRLDEGHDWLSILSLGEQQRLNFARIILAKPKWLIMDEPTASMDKPLEAKLFAILLQELPDLTLITIGHAPSLKELHTRCIEL